jgi:phosphoribosylamine--glycine ligase
MKILLIGSGGREHAIAQALAKSRHQPELYFAPGNPGMAPLGQRLDIEVTDIQGLKLFAQREQIDLTIVGPELPLSLGLADEFVRVGLKVFGSKRQGARLESSKAFSKQLMARYHIPTAGYRFCETQAEALTALEAFTPPFVIKEDGLAAGKGVTIAKNKGEAEEAISRAFQKDMPVVIEEFMQGQELSVLAFCDGKNAIPCIAAQDFKRVGEGDTGPNTGGMGAYAPVPLATPNLLERVQAEIINPTVQALQAEGIEYCGILYTGLMIAPDGSPKVVEFNVRFGDPETQVVLPLLEEDLVDVMLATVNGELDRYVKTGLRFKPDTTAVTVTLASQGYPGDYRTGVPITFPSFLPPDVQIFHAGTRLMPDQSIVTAGGRVLNVTALAPDTKAARALAYATAEQIQFSTRYYRRDIAASPAQAVL